MESVEVLSLIYMLCRFGRGPVRASLTPGVPPRPVAPLLLHAGRGCPVWWAESGSRSRHRVAGQGRNHRPMMLGWSMSALQQRMA